MYVRFLEVLAPVFEKSSVSRVEDDDIAEVLVALEPLIQQQTQVQS